MDGGPTEKGDLKNGGSNSHSVFLSSLSYSDSEMELEIELEEGTTVSGSELRAILDKQLVYISGGLEEDRRPILTFPEVGLKYLENLGGFKELTTTLLYFKTLTCFTGLSAGISLLLDARTSKTHVPVKQLLDKLVSKEIPLDVHIVYVYMKSRIFGRGKPLASPEAASKLQIKYLYDQKALLDQLESSNVTTDLGGALCYDHKTWVHNRLDYENVRQMHRKTTTRYPKFTKALDHSKLPSSVKQAERLMQADLKLKESFENKMAEALQSNDRFLEALKQQQPGATMQMALDTKEHIKMMVSLKLMHQELKEKQDQLSSFWLAHKTRMEHVIHMCNLNERTDEMRVVMRGYAENVNKEGSILGDTLETALEYGEKFGELVTKYKATLDESMEKIDEDAHVLINPDFVSDEEGKMHSATQQAIDNVKTQVEELKKSYKELTDLCQQKRDTFVLCMKFHMMTRQVQQWNQDVLEFLATLYLEDMSEEDASANLSKIEGFTDSTEESQLATIDELANSLPPEKHFKKTAGNLKEKYEQACGLLDVRKSHILKKLAALRTPDPPPTVLEEKEPTESAEDNSKSPESESEPASSSSQSQSLPTITTEDTDSPAKAVPEEESPEHTDGESDANVLKNRQFVYKELLATEKVYIDDLKTVLHGYYDTMDPEENTSIPLRLRDKRGIVFGNLPEIYKFHETVFSKALEQYEDHPANIGECFVQHMEEFQMYSVYCKNRSQSEALINESTESQAFFKGIQMNLAHQLSLDSYLLKPVQRITKYQLLLKDMMKHSVKAKVAHSELKKALDGMLKVLKNLNDSLHVVGLKGFPGALAEQGRLLVHDPFQLWEKSAAGRSLFSRAHERHVFLFEKMIIFSKKNEASSQKKDRKSDNYLYKGHLSMAEIGLRPTIGGQPLQFELNLHGQQKVYILQAQNKEVHDMWTSEIRRLLEAQLVLMKDIVIKSGTLNRRAYKGKAKLSTHARDSRFFAESVETQSLTVGQIKRQRNGRVKKKKAVHSFVESSLLVTQSLPPNAVHSLKGDEDAMSEDDASDEDDISITTAMELYETLAPSAPRHCLAISDYNPGGSDENGISLTEAQEVEVIGVNQFGWWWVRAINASSGEMEEGWVPASYLRCQLTHL